MFIIVSLEGLFESILLMKKKASHRAFQEDFPNKIIQIFIYAAGFRGSQ